MTALVLAPANAWAEAQELGWQIEAVTLPWDRSFEIDLQLRPMIKNVEVQSEARAEMRAEDQAGGVA